MLKLKTYFLRSQASFTARQSTDLPPTRIYGRTLLAFVTVKQYKLEKAEWMNS